MSLLYRFICITNACKSDGGFIIPHRSIVKINRVLMLYTPLKILAYIQLEARGKEVKNSNILYHIHLKRITKLKRYYVDHKRNRVIMIPMFGYYLRDSAVAVFLQPAHYEPHAIKTPSLHFVFVIVSSYGRDRGV